MPSLWGYQDWRHYLPFGESTLALLLSVVALTAVFLTDPKAPLKEFNDYLSGTSFAMSAALVDMDTNFASVLVQNNQNSPAAINSLSCSLNLQLDPNFRIHESLRSLSEGSGDGSYPSLTEKDTMGLFLIAFEVKQAVLIRPYEAAAITLPMAHISPPLRSKKERSLGESVTSICIVFGTNLEDEFAVGGILVSPRQLNNLDLLDVLERADYGEKREHERGPDLSVVRDARAKARGREEAENSQ